MPTSTSTASHAEENLMRNVNGLKRVGTSRPPCGVDRNNCAGQLAERGIEVDNL